MVHPIQGAGLSASVTTDVIRDFLLGGDWHRRFDAGAREQGKKLARARQVGKVTGECLETGDVEIAGTVTEKSGQVFQPVVAIWEDGDALAVDADCACTAGVNCSHAVAVLEYLGKGKGERLEAAFGGTPHAERMTRGKVLVVEPIESPSEAIELAAGAESPGEPRFLFRLECRPPGNERLAWLPDRHGQAFAIYGDHRVPLSPAGNLPPIVTPEEKIRRNRARETEALNLLYALNFLPGAEKPPQSLPKLDRPPVEGNGTLWAVDRKEWPHPEFFWQRFRHEGVAALERRGWEVRFAPDFGLEPLVFKTDTWRTEIVEEGRGWFHLSAGFEIDGEPFALQPILAALVANRFLDVTEGLPDGQEFMIFLPDGRGLALPVGRFRKILATLGELMEFKFPPGSGPDVSEPILVSKLDAALLATLAGEDTGGDSESLFDFEMPFEVATLAERIGDFESIERVAVPDGLEATLREYQLDGFHWLQFLARYGLNGILADDMGLGKTLQTLAHLVAEREADRDEDRPSLVIAPTSVVENWQREAAKFAPGLEVLILQGSARRRRFQKIPEADLVLTSYALIARDLEVYLEHEFHLIALDEAQHVKNPGAQVTVAVGRLQSRHRLCLSGTPVENHLGELWSLMNFLMPGFLGGRERFTETYRTPIEKNGNEERRAALARRIGPLVLRRTKHDVAKELPPKTEIAHRIEMSEAQKDFYETVRSTMDKQVRQALAVHGNQSQIVFLDALLKLRQICCHPGLLDGHGEEEVSAKFDYLVDLLDTFRREGNRVLLFSQFTSMLAIIEAHLVEEKFAYLKLTGETKNRQELVERFQGGEGEVFLISLKAGGTGLTLTGADIVIHYDPWWNPAAENQATDRAYRIGQDKPVFVHKLICKDTVEERIRQMQEKKDDLAGGMLSGATQQLALTPETLAGLLGESQ